MKLFRIFLTLAILGYFTLCFAQETASSSISGQSSYNDFADITVEVTASTYYEFFMTAYYFTEWKNGSNWVQEEIHTEKEDFDFMGGWRSWSITNKEYQIVDIADRGNGTFRLRVPIEVNTTNDRDTLQFTVTDVVAPSAPTNLTISNSGGNPKLDWDANSEEDLRRYRVYRVDGDPTSWIVSGTSYTDDEVEISQQGNYVIYKVKAEDWTSNLSSASNQDSIRGILGKPIVQRGTSLRNSFFLSQNYPNPFNPTTTISLDIPKETNVDLQIFNIKGQIINNLINTRLEPGNYEVKFDASSLPSGVYFYRISAGRYSDVKRMLVVK